MSSDASIHQALMRALDRDTDSFTELLTELTERVGRDRVTAILNSVSPRGQTALIVCIERGELELVEMLVKEFKVPTSTADGTKSTPLIAAICSSAEDIVQFLLSAPGKLNLDAADNQGCTALHWALRLSQSDVAKSLIERGARVDLATTTGMQPLHDAAAENLVELLPVLVQRGANVSAIDKKGNTPLHFAMSKGHLDAVEVLTEKLASPVDGQCLADDNAWHQRVRNHNGDTVLHIAAANGNLKQYCRRERQLEASADVCGAVKERQPTRPKRRVCRENGHSAVVEYLLANGGLEIDAAPAQPSAGEEQNDSDDHDDDQSDKPRKQLSSSERANMRRRARQHKAPAAAAAHASRDESHTSAPVHGTQSHEAGTPTWIIAVAVLVVILFVLAFVLRR
ncbi:hypothetical protein CAOG_02415 [Capsaspora owczarzaki ATCC 30864]|uniref:hypothetical protein n=1 Tax=Capsaspora owczarzaki (strain ATCC 30864) TaxID=595528 RepID=UPI0003524772|nr:hypothetical protein CAOG_02415 [Capsaspora owczarzaki ATCC 30864]|eukprot:XP_004349165.2 hypothetical protein CAOG_02415 [Capsaspora owczarzaki ATCC 30864]